jgi:hypothetical protein
MRIALCPRAEKAPGPRPPGGTLPEPEPTHQTTLYLPAALWEQAKLYAVYNRTNLTAVVVEALRAFLKAKRKER